MCFYICVYCCFKNNRPLLLLVIPYRFPNLNSNQNQNVNPIFCLTDCISKRLITAFGSVFFLFFLSLSFKQIVDYYTHYCGSEESSAMWKISLIVLIRLFSLHVIVGPFCKVYSGLHSHFRLGI